MPLLLKGHMAVLLLKPMIPMRVPVQALIVIYCLRQMQRAINLFNASPLLQQWRGGYALIFFKEGESEPLTASTARIFYNYSKKRERQEHVTPSHAPVFPVFLL